MQFMKQSDLEKLWFSKWVYPKALRVDTTLVFTIKISWWKVFFGGGSYLRILLFFLAGDVICISRFQVSLLCIEIIFWWNTFASWVKTTNLGKAGQKGCCCWWFTSQSQELHHSSGRVALARPYFQADNRESRRILQGFEARRALT